MKGPEIPSIPPQEAGEEKVRAAAPWESEKLPFDRFLRKLDTYRTRPDAFPQQIALWKKEGISIEPYLEHPQSREILAKGVHDFLLMSGVETPYEYARFAQEWKKIGIDLGASLDFPDTKALFVRQVEKYAKLGVVGAEQFAVWADRWKAVSFDVEKILNEKDTQASMTKRVFALRDHDISPKPFAQAWMGVGWKPEPEVLHLLESL